MVSEEQLIEKCRNNDLVAQKMLYDRYAPIMLGICMRYVYERSEAEDILQEGFLKIFTKIGEFEGRGSFEGWMKRVFVNTAITHYHKNSKHNKYHGTYLTFLSQLHQKDILQHISNPSFF